MKLNVKSFALTTALLWGLGLFTLTWWIIAFEGVNSEVTIIGKLYKGYSFSPLGSFIGLIWAFIDGLIIGALFAWVYNKISAKNGKD